MQDQLATHSDIMTAQSFPTFDPISETLLFYKDRQAVHTDGDWHKGVQANIIRKCDNREFEILVQQRTNNVDIGLGKLDQSLASQMIREDDLSEASTLARGLVSELSITDYNAVKISPKIRIVKTYVEHPDTINRELLSLFLVTIHDSVKIHPDAHKIERITWMKWSDMIKAINAEPSCFSKTAQFYFLCHPFAYYIEQMSRKMLSLDYDMTVKPISDIVHVDRVNARPITLFGDIETNLRQVGELK